MYITTQRFTFHTRLKCDNNVSYLSVVFEIFMAFYPLHIQNELNIILFLFVTVLSINALPISLVLF